LHAGKNAHGTIVGRGSFCFGRINHGRWHRNCAVFLRDEIAGGLGLLAPDKSKQANHAQAVNSQATLENCRRMDAFDEVCNLSHKYDGALLIEKVNRSSFCIPATYVTD
jgi:hypothetical protein